MWETPLTFPWLINEHSLQGQCVLRVVMILQRWLLILAVEFIFPCISGRAMGQGRRCVFQAKPQNKKYRMAGNVSGSEQLCARTHCCVGYYQMVNGQPEVDLLACDIVEKSCPDATCAASPRFNNRLIKCVCNTDLCNSNITWKPKSEEPQRPYSYSVDIINITVAIIPIGIVLFLCCMLVAVKCLHHENTSPHDEPGTPLCSCHTAETSEIDSASVELKQIVSHGHYATVWQGNYQGSMVAVKVFSAGCKHEFTSEREVYELPLMKHAGIVRFLGAGRKADGGEWLIVLELAACGSLHSFLSKQTSSWMSSLRLCLSLSQGLAYLHSNLNRHGVHKPAVAHRDLSSSNVLVKADGTCALTDFGHSTILHSCPGHNKWQCYLGNMESPAQAGTLRYMSPEILEGSVNLSSGWCLMQGDVYALGLLLWEIWMRCSNLFEGGLIPDHQLPYEAELGASVTLEGLILHVSHMDRRPPIPKCWEDVPQGSALQELVMDCWDHDPDARLTAQCVVDRIFSLQ
ncbi:anti-Muellerian hormone type-2 receptor isoform X2 [Myripristis murdjan]|uniref:receptor protein serine/threonine kinase n=1 Tax=Myripristis murdjan TaxID=586833 RepID=A0A667WSJ4_9TELE|nr:anti-Muellerian hormone type-2 receptor isoform X2 [Myripristis murdjan]